MSWLPIETAPRCKDVLVRSEIGTLHVAANHHGKWECWWLHEINNPTHWMPLPPPPKDE